MINKYVNRQKNIPYMLHTLKTQHNIDFIQSVHRELLIPRPILHTQPPSRTITLYLGSIELYISTWLHHYHHLLQCR